MSENLTRATIGNLKWTYGGAAVSAILQLGYTAVMGRLLTPQDFGLVAMALVFLRFASYFAEMGVGPALVQRPALSRRAVRAAHTSGTLLGLLFAALVAAAAPLAAAFFDAPQVVGVVRLMALTFVVNGVGLTAVSLLQRELRFRQLAVIEVVSYAAGYLLIGIVFALNGAGPYSLVAAALGQALLQTVLAYLAVRHPAVPLLAGRELRELYSFGGQVTAISFLEFIGSSLDTLVIGRFAGAAALGQYNRALLLVTLPLQRAMFGFSNVFFATLSRIQSDLARIRGVYVSALRVGAAVLLPIAAGVAVAADEIVQVVLGAQWAAAANVLPLLAFAVAFDLLSHLGGVVCEAVAALRWKLVLQAAFVVGLAALLLASTGGSLRVYAGAVAVAQLARLCGYLVLMDRVLDVGHREHLRSFGGPVLAAGLVAVAIALVTNALRPLGPPAVGILAAQVLTGAAILALQVAVGPLASVRREALARVVSAGYFRSAVGTGGVIDRMLR